MNVDETDKGTSNLSFPVKLFWCFIGVLCVINLYIFLILFMKIALPGLAHHYAKNDFIRIGVIAVLVLLVKAVMDNLARSKLFMFIGFNTLLLMFNALAIWMNWF